MATPLPSPRHHAALSARTALTPVVRLTFTRGDEEETFIPISGNLLADARRSLRWSGSVRVGAEVPLPRRPGDLLTPFGTRVTTEVGVQLADGTESVVPFGSYILTAATADINPAAQTATVQLSDLAIAVADYRFESPFTVLGGADLAEVVNAVIADRTGVNPDLDDTGATISRKRIFGLDPQKDPWRELQELVGGFGLRVYYDRTGAIALDSNPTPSLDAATFVEGPTSVRAVFEKRPPNVVVARGEASDDSPPIQAVVMDDDPTSPTWAGDTAGGSPYGRVTRFFASPLITTPSEAEATARSILAGSAAGGAAWSVGRPFDPTRDPDDVLVVELAEDDMLTVAVDAVSFGIGGLTMLECRDLSSLVDQPAEVAP